MFIEKSKAVYIDSFGIEHIPQEILNKIKYKWITHNIFRIQSDVSILYGFYCFAFLEYMIAQNLSEYGNLFFPVGCKKNDKIIYNHFKNKYNRKKHQFRIKI